MRSVLPIILLVLAAGLFMVYTNPTYQGTEGIKELSAEAAQYDKALTQSSQLRSARDELLAKRNTFATDDVRKLERVLPDNVDNIRLIIDIQNIAARYHLQVRNVALGASSADSQGGALSVGSGSQAVGSVELGFGISATYNDFIAFLQDLEKSVRVVDVEAITFSTSDGDQQNYKLQIKTYWLR